jgi:hypothetical protein
MKHNDAAFNSKSWFHISSGLNGFKVFQVSIH